MARLFGKCYTREELLTRVGDVSQLARVKPYRLVDGFEDGVRALDITNGSGLEFTVLASRGMDISAASYRGRPLAWRSATSDQHPAFVDPEGRGWLRSFYGGLVTTCGLTYMGASCTDGGTPLGLHGRASHLPAANVCYSGHWIDDEYHLKVSGVMREATVFGENLQWTRTISTRLGEGRLFLHDRIENLGYESVPHMILYHINAGFPVVDSRSVISSPSCKVTPRDADAQENAENWYRMQEPTQSYREKAYFHDMQSDDGGRVHVQITNPEIEGGFGIYVGYEKSELPCFTEWKMMDKGTYVVGLEPGNALPLGRDVERDAGRLQVLEPGEVREYHLEIGVLCGGEPVAVGA